MQDTVWEESLGRRGPQDSVWEESLGRRGTHLRVSAWGAHDSWEPPPRPPLRPPPESLAVDWLEERKGRDKGKMLKRLEYPHHQDSSLNDTSEHRAPEAGAERTKS